MQCFSSFARHSENEYLLMFRELRNEFRSSLHMHFLWHCIHVVQDASRHVNSELIERSVAVLEIVVCETKSP